MIHHLSVAAHDPKAVAEFFAELTDGVAIDFPPNPGSYMAFTLDPRKGTGVEVYPAGSLHVSRTAKARRDLHPRRGQQSIERSAPPTSPSVSEAHGAAEGGGALAKARPAGIASSAIGRRPLPRGGRVWIENAWLVEVLPPVFAEEYLGFANQVAGMANPNSALDSHQPQAQGDVVERVSTAHAGRGRSPGRAPSRRQAEAQPQSRAWDAAHSAGDIGVGFDVPAAAQGRKHRLVD